jgi:isochorismate hydrolase
MRQTKGKDEMDAIAVLKNKRDRTDLERAVLYVSDPQKYDIDYIDIEKAAAELAALTAERDALFNIAVKAMEALEDINWTTAPKSSHKLDKALSYLPTELWKRVDEAALKAAK